MGLPTLSKTWQFNVNNQVTAQGSAIATNRKLLRGIKTALIGFGTLPWAVRYSCDSVAAGSAGDAVDRWDADTDLVWNTSGSAHSWIVLRQTGVSSTFELLISCEAASASGSNVTLVVSTSAFSGGSTTARPTATDEVVLLSGQWNSSFDVAARYSVWQSTDGECTRVVVSQSSTTWGVWLIEKPANPSSSWTTPYVAMALYANTAATINTYLTGTESAGMARIRSGSTTGKCSLTVEGTSAPIAWDTAFGNVANEISGAWDFWPVGFVCLTTGVRGRHGNFTDLFMGSGGVSTLDCYPNDGSNQFVQLFGLIHPWNGSTPALS